ncbi:hypothetical protein HPB47_006711, partial [Ixodes persulcatus]
EELIDRLLTDATQNPPNALAPATLFPTMPAFTTDEAENMQRMAAFLHQNMAVMMTTLANQANQVHVTTLPDLSASLPTFNGGGTPTFKHWIEELERTQRLARWEDPTLLAIAQGKLRGVAADWHASTGRQLTTWTIWKAGMKEQFGEQLSLIQWQQKVTALTQKPGDSLQQYAFAKLKIMSRCPVPITDKERIEYLVQGIRDDQIATSIAVHRPRTVDDFLNIVSEVDRTIDHSRLARTRTFPKPTWDGRFSASGSTMHFNCTPGTPQTGRTRIADMPPDEQEARNHNAIGHNRNSYRTTICPRNNFNATTEPETDSSETRPDPDRSLGLGPLEFRPLGLRFTSAGVWTSGGALSRRRLTRSGGSAESGRDRTSGDQVVMADPARREHLHERDARRLASVEVPSAAEAATALEYC